jgi:lauroyl/myristoyl acyltransferase
VLDWVPTGRRTPDHLARADQWDRAVALRDGDYWSRYAGTHIFLRGDTRSMVRFLTPGRCFLVQVDYGLGRVVEIDWGSSRWQVASGAFRLARLTNAAVVPIVALDDGPWRYRVHVATPVPDSLIAAGDDAASAAHVLGELMPLIAQVPDQLMGWRPMAAAESGLGGQPVRDS